MIGILNTWSELTPCNAHLRDLAEKVKFGIYEAGGFPVEVPVFSASESAFRPTAMMFRNLAAMAVELVVAQTGGGPGGASEVPAKYVYDSMFGGQNLGQGFAASTMMLLSVVIILIPWAYLEFGGKKHG